MNITKSDLTARAKNLGYSIKIQDGEIEAYPKGMRGDASIFESDDQDGRISIINTMRADRDNRFRARLAPLPIDEDTREALVRWHAYHGTEWLENLVWQGWFSGRYDGDSLYNYAGLLQRLRNTNGHEVLAMLEPRKMGA